jgi:hypothetical protein
MGTGGMGQGGGGTGGGSGCIAITPDGFAVDQANGNAAAYVSTFTPNVDGVEDDFVNLELYGDPLNGGDLGTFDLTMGDDANYATCARCFRAFVDFEGANPRFFFQSAGTLEVTGSAPLDGALDATVTGLTLIEVTIDPDTFVSTPVPGGACLEIATADINTVPAGWTCDPALYNSGMATECNCGCGVVDPDCADDTSASCDSCNDMGSCDEAGSDCSQIDATDNSGCAAPAGWTCDPDYYSDTLCDCGCGVLDPACADATSASCDYCDDPGSCGEQFGCGVINDTNNAICDTGPVGWTCNPAYYTDADCDCGCGIADPACADATSASCDYCSDPGSCAENANCSLINDTNNAICDAPPVGWTCSLAYYDTGLAGDCDCGCGIFDPDCANLLATSCDYCDDTGSCATDCTEIDPTNNPVCI